MCCPSPEGVKPSLINLIHSCINFSLLAGWFSLQRVLGRLSISLAGDSFMSLLLQCPWLQPPGTTDHRALKEEGQYVPKHHLLFLSVFSVVLLLTMFNAPKSSALVVDESGEVCWFFRLLEVTLSFGAASWSGTCYVLRGSGVSLADLSCPSWPRSLWSAPSITGVMFLSRLLWNFQSL